MGYTCNNYWWKSQDSVQSVGVFQGHAAYGEAGNDMVHRINRSSEEKFKQWGSCQKLHILG